MVDIERDNFLEFWNTYKDYKRDCITIDEVWDVWNCARKWIDITDRLPPNESDVIIITYGEIYHAYVQDGLFLVDNTTSFLVDDVAYWYLVPELEEENNGN